MNKHKEMGKNYMKNTSKSPWWHRRESWMGGRTCAVWLWVLTCSVSSPRCWGNGPGSAPEHSPWQSSTGTLCSGLARPALLGLPWSTSINLVSPFKEDPIFNRYIFIWISRVPLPVGALWRLVNNYDPCFDLTWSPPNAAFPISPVAVCE